MKKEVELFFMAVLFYTRIPVPNSVKYREEYADQSFKYVSLIGLLVGGLAALVLLVSLRILPDSIAVILSMLSSVLITGAFHEDGLADSVDGFGGGWTKQKILKIMKDSSIGAYGTIALIFVLFLKYQLLLALLRLPIANEISTSFFILFVFISAHSISRFVAISSMITHSYAREDDPSSKLKSLTSQQLKWTNSSIIFAAIVALLPVFLFKTPLAFIVLVPVYLVKIALSKFFNKWIGGYTGDCLGAIQQISEIVFYIGILLLWKFI